jgi:hypothetical protein
MKPRHRGRDQETVLCEDKHVPGHVWSTALDFFFEDGGNSDNAVATVARRWMRPRFYGAPLLWEEVLQNRLRVESMADGRFPHGFAKVELRKPGDLSEIAWLRCIDLFRNVDEPQSGGIALA